MLILPKKKAIFYHVYKVAGSSIRNALLPYGSKTQIYGQYINHIMTVARLPKSSNPLLAYHPKLADVKTKMGVSFYNHYRFAFVREPLDWQKSLYFFMQKKAHLPGNKRVADMTFDEYLTWRMEHELRHQTDFLYDDDECLVNDIFHLETIDEDFKKLTEKLDIETTLPHLNKAGSGKKVEISDNVLDRFRRLHQVEYERLGYPLP
ncbi:sulfotransferase family 2 domain-containing protein [Celeribacter halophilus]|uniref:sulfotransferase family 2 domain-containing protein n=1 Tax=Celeribacter halophilus TaxID=576117 RepID=UPI003A8EC1E6